ncbi:MAG: biopolymer transporter ExbD [Pseudomonadales bacterium]
MDRVRKRIKKHHEAADLDVTPFMNLMIVLVPVLLLSMVFTHTTVIDLNFPGGEASAAELDPETVHLEVTVRGDALVVADGRGGVIRSLPKQDGGYDFAELSKVMQELKRRMPEKQDIMVLLEADIPYQTLVSVMDTVRSYPTVQYMEVVQAELFPVISLGDAPGSEAPADGVAQSSAQGNGGRS